MALFRITSTKLAEIQVNTDYINLFFLFYKHLRAIFFHVVFLCTFYNLLAHILGS